MSRRKEFFPEVTDQQWNDWHWQVKNRIETVDELKKYIKLTAEEEEGIRESLKTLRMAITPYYLTLIDPENPLPDPQAGHSYRRGAEAFARRPGRSSA